MRKRRDPSAGEDDDGRKLISLQDKHDADRQLQQAFAAGELVTEHLLPALLEPTGQPGPSSG